ncbi:MAG: hypothetical protein U1A77_10170 [Pirellulales bacterium]
MGMRKLSAERLEKRMVMAGNVTALVNSAGDLLIDGDSDDNVLSVESIGPAEWQVSVANLTTLNGSYVPMKFTARGSVFINLGDGNDWLGVVGRGMNKVTVVNPVTIKAGSGADLVTLNDLATRSDVKILGEAGDDQLYLTNVALQRRVFIEGNAGKDGVVLTNCVVQGEVNIDGGEQDDLIAFNDGNFQQNVTVVGGTGGDVAWMFGPKSAKTLRIDLGASSDADNDTLDARRMNAVTDLEVFAGGGNDTLIIANSTIGRNARIVGDVGEEFFYLKDSRVGSIQIELGALGDLANDSAYFHGVNAGNLRLTMGDGNNYIEFDSVVVRQELNIRTDAGLDMLKVNRLQAHDRFFLDMGDDVDTANISESLIRRAWFDSGEGSDLLNLYNVRVSQWMLLRF